MNTIERHERSCPNANGMAFETARGSRSFLQALPSIFKDQV